MEHGARARVGGRRSGQASAELVAILPALAVCVLIVAQAVAAGWALWAAGNAARAGARAEHVGSDGEAVARRALPGLLRRGASVRTDDGVRVSVPVPALVPGASLGSISAASSLDAGTD